MAHVHGHCGHGCSCSFPADNGCVADLVTFISETGAGATMQDMQNLIDVKYGQPPTSAWVGPTDIP